MFDFNRLYDAASRLTMAAGAPQGSGGQGGSPGGELMSTLLMFGVIFLVFYFLLIRPQQKRQKEHQTMLEALKRGDEVVTAGGVHGKIRAVAAQTMRLEIAQGVVITIDKGQVGRKKTEAESAAKPDSEEKENKEK